MRSSRPATKSRGHRLSYGVGPKRMGSFYIRRLWSNCPGPLRVAALASSFFAVLLPLTTVLPGSNFNLAVTQLSHDELWATGVALALIASAPLMSFVAAGITLAKPWVRPLLVAIPWLQYLPFQFAYWLGTGPDPTPSPTAYWFGCSAMSGLTLLYLLFSERARRYFTHSAQQAVSADVHASAALRRGRG
jgi:hypothetical protein